VGRHNAVDKVLGRALMDGRLPLNEHVLMVSGRAGFEIVEKAVGAGVAVVCAVSAPSSLAVATAEEFGATLVGFLRGRSANIYTAADRLATPTPTIANSRP
jgi:FdhD protein